MRRYNIMRTDVHNFITAEICQWLYLWHYECRPSSQIKWLSIIQKRMVRGWTVILIWECKLHKHYPLRSETGWLLLKQTIKEHSKRIHSKMNTFILECHQYDVTIKENNIIDFAILHSSMGYSITTFCGWVFTVYFTICLHCFCFTFAICFQCLFHDNGSKVMPHITKWKERCYHTNTRFWLPNSPVFPTVDMQYKCNPYKF